MLLLPESRLVKLVSLWPFKPNGLRIYESVVLNVEECWSRLKQNDILEEEINDRNIIQGSSEQASAVLLIKSLRPCITKEIKAKSLGDKLTDYLEQQSINI